jgi:hypothetical protein
MIKKEEYMIFLKKYQKVHCQPISLLNKSELKKLAEKHGFNKSETKQDETKQDETKNSLTDFFPESKAKQKKPKKAKVVPPSLTLEQVRKMIKDHDVSSEIQVAMSGSDYKKWRAEDKRLHKMLDPFKKVKS